jgi:NADPH:quinone reductase-like Zn-dependent oxidoreductase
VAIHQDLAIALPPSFTFEEGAAIPEVFLTAFQALVWYGRLKKGDRVLIHAGASGVGTAAIQIVRALEATPFVTVSAGKRQACLDLGAEIAIDYAAEDFSEVIRGATGGEGVDIVIDFIGGPYLRRNVDSLALDGRIVILATLGGNRVEEFDLRSVFRKRGTIITSTLRNRSLEYKVKLTNEFAALCMPMFESGVLRPVIDRVYDWESVADAHRYMEASGNVGKIVLQVRSA